MSREDETNKNIEFAKEWVIENGSQSSENSLTMIAICLADISKNLAYLCDLLEKEGGMQE